MILPALILTLIAVYFKPLVFQKLLEREHEKASMAARPVQGLGKSSEFSLLIVVVALKLEILSSQAGLLIQAATLLSFIVSSYWIVQRYPTPIAVDASLRRD